MPESIIIKNIHACPHLILSVEHWRDPYTCRCGERDYPLMAERGYVWDEDEGCWVSPSR